MNFARYFPASFPWVTSKFPAPKEQGIQIERIREVNRLEQGRCAKNREAASLAELTVLLGPVERDVLADQAGDAEVGTLAPVEDRDLQFW